MEVLERFALGDLEAFEILFREFQGEVYRCTYRIVRDAATAEDLTVEPFGISIASSKPSLRCRKSFGLRRSWRSLRKSHTRKLPKSWAYQLVLLSRESFARFAC